MATSKIIKPTENYKIKYGLSQSTQVAANSYSDVPITFDEPFEEKPAVITSIYSSSTAGAMGSTMVSAINISTNGFTARVFNAGSSVRAPAVNWMAIGK